MKMTNCKVIGLLVPILLLTPLLVSAEDLSISPMEWDFGDVELAASRSQVFTLTSHGPTAVWVYVVATTPVAGVIAPICAGGLSADHCSMYPSECTACDFAVTYISQPLPMEHPAGDTLDVEVTFTPSALGRREAFLFVQSNDSVGLPGTEAWIPLIGFGVDASSPPGGLMADLLAFFDAAVADGSLTGSGSGSSAPHRLKAFRNMLQASSDLIEAHAYDLACTQLQDALNHSDGLAPPPDFVDGTGRGDLAAGIVEVMSALGCP